MNTYSYMHIRKIKNSIGVEKAIETSTSLKLLSDPTRLKIICLLFANKGGLCVYEVAEEVDISHSAASHQLSKLEARGVVESFREGQTICYKIVKNSLTKDLGRVIKVFKN